MRSLIIRIHGPKVSGNEIEKNEIGGHKTCMGRGETYRGCCGGNVKNETTWKTEV
jgi:hypothetical protein